MENLEIPLGKRTKLYRFFEMVPAIVSYGAIILLVVLSLFSPLLAAVYLLMLIITLLVKAIGIAAHTIMGHRRLVNTQLINWHRRLQELEDPEKSYQTEASHPIKEFGNEVHIKNLKRLASHPEDFPKPSTLFNAVIIATYNESYEILEPTIRSLIKTTYDKDHMIVVLAYEERGGPTTKKTAERLAKEFAGSFKAFQIVEHPANLPDELVGKGANITHAGYFLKDWLPAQHINYSQVIVTTLDSDNRPHPTYFDYVTYEYIVHENRTHYSYQPVSLFLNNIWDAPAPMRVIATGNSFWNIISSMRPQTLRNFASHSQPMDALVGMNFWSKRTIVEDGHQYWRSYFHFRGDYMVIPIYVPIYQDAVLSETYRKTLKAQFIQLRRWSYGASDVPYVATRGVFTRHRVTPFWPTVARLFRLISDHVTLASLAILVAVGGWVPLLVNQQAARDIAAHQLPVVVSDIQKIAMLGLFVTILLGIRLLPPRPERYKRHHSIFMVTQWILMPVTSIVYSAFAAFNAQTHLLLGKYLEKFDVTEKATHQSVARAQQAKSDRDASGKQSNRT